MATIVITKTSNGGTFQRDGGSVYSLFGQPDGLYDFGNKIVFKDQYEDLSFYSTDAVTIDGVSQSGNTAVQIAANLRAVFPDANSSSGGSGPESAFQYTGQIATRCYLPTKIYASHAQTMSRSYHVMRESVTSLQIGIPNWYSTQSGNVTEIDSAISATLTASIEYPVGVFNQLKFKGSATGTALAGETTVTDALNISIPKGDTFWVRIYRVAPGNIFTTQQPANYLTLGGFRDSLHITTAGNGIDQTMGGTVDTGFSEGFFPAFIIGKTTRATVFMIGDSRILGDRSTINDYTGDQGNIAPSIGEKLAYINAATSGDRAMWAITTLVKRLALAQYCTHIVIGYGINDINLGGRSAAQIAADLSTIAQKFIGKKVFVLTVEPYSQDATTVRSTNASHVVPLNTLIRAARPLNGMEGYFDLSDAVSTARDSGLWKTNYPDGSFLHAFGTAAQAGIKTSGAITPAMFTR